MIQGGILSPKLFNIFYDTLLDKLEKEGIFFIAYADDIVIATLGASQIKKNNKNNERMGSQIQDEF